MKSIMRNLAFFAVAVMYIVSTMGYGVHRCTADGTASIILLFGETPCEYVHSHIDSHGNTYTHSHAHDGHHHSGDCADDHCGKEECSCSHHSSNCCSTKVYVLTEDQNIGQEDCLVAPDFQIINGMAVYLPQQFAAVAVELGQSEYNLKIFPYKEGPQAVLCTFRI